MKEKSIKANILLIIFAYDFHYLGARYKILKTKF